MASRPFQFLEKKRSKIRKRASKHFEGLAALSTHSAGQRAEVKAGCKPVHFSLETLHKTGLFSDIRLYNREGVKLAFCRVQRTPMRFRADAVQSTTDALKQCIFSYSRGFITTV